MLHLAFALWDNKVLWQINARTSAQGRGDASQKTFAGLVYCIINSKPNEVAVMLHFAYELCLPCPSEVIHTCYCLGFFPSCLFSFIFLPAGVVLGGTTSPKHMRNVTTANPRYLQVRHQNHKMQTEISACWICLLGSEVIRYIWDMFLCFSLELCRLTSMLCGEKEKKMEILT